ncbi:TPA: hypothetical protein TU158_001603 [Streptococcus equi subsp. zooepidemicus]|nr:hypothetical protein [Streptococcus equi subsp. zooepidemicus]
MKKSTKAFIALIILIGGLFMAFSLNNPDINHKSEEELRNYEYEVSLVKALKNSYKGIEEITITNPHYTIPPGNWSCDLELIFNDTSKISYRIGHNVDDDSNYNGALTYRQSDFLKRKRGTTDIFVKVTFSDGTERSV